MGGLEADVCLEGAEEEHAIIQVLPLIIRSLISIKLAHSALE